MCVCVWVRFLKVVNLRKVEFGKKNGVGRAFGSFIRLREK